MARDTLMFPVGFDFSEAIKESEIKKTLDRVEKIVKSSPVVLSTLIDTTGLDHMKRAYGGTIDDLKKRISQLNEMWSQIDPSNMYNAAGDALSSTITQFKKTVGFDPDGKRILEDEYTSVKKLYDEYEQLIAIMSNYAKSLSQVHSERMQQLAEEEREQRKRYAAPKGLSAGLSIGSTTQGDVAIQKLILEYNKLQEKIERLTAAYERMKAIESERPGTYSQDQFNKVLERRMALQERIAQITQTADEANAKRLETQTKINQQLEFETRHNEAIQALQQRVDAAKNKPYTAGATTQIEKISRAYLDQKAIVDSLVQSIANIELKKATMEAYGQNRSADYQKQYNDLLKEREVLYGKLLTAQENLHQKKQTLIDTQKQEANQLVRRIEQENKAYQQQQQLLSELDAERVRQAAAQNKLLSTDSSLKKATDEYNRQEQSVRVLKQSFERAAAARERLERSGAHKTAEGLNTKAYEDALRAEKEASEAYTKATKELTVALSNKIREEQRWLEQREKERIALENQRKLISELNSAITKTQLSRMHIAPNTTELEKAENAVNQLRLRVQDLTSKYRQAQSEREQFDHPIRKSKAAYDKEGYMTTAYKDALKKEQQAARDLLQVETQLTSAMQTRADAQTRADEQARRDLITVNNLQEAITSLKNRVQDYQNAQNNLGSYVSQYERITKSIADQEVVVGLLRNELSSAAAARQAYEAAGKTKNKDNTANKEYISALEKEKQLAQQLEKAEQQLLTTQERRLQLLRQIGLSGNLENVGSRWSLNGGLDDTTAIDAQIARYEDVKRKIHELGIEYERLKALHMQAGSDVRNDQNAIDILNERIRLTKELAKITQTADQAQAEALKQQEALQSKINARIEARRKKRSDEINNNRKETAILRRNENTLNNINAKLAVYRAKLSRMDFKADPAGFKRIQDEITRLLDLLEKYDAKTKSIGKSTKDKQHEVVDTYREHHTWLGRLIQRAALFASAGTIVGMVKKVKDITAEFELQRISLGAIIRDQSKANTLFSEIKRFALDSPLKIMDLTKYTKQLAAYRIESDKLFDTTKRLADVSVGLGVSMDRLILAYGQVRATGYLRASEVRQFTEAGLPIVELIAEQLSKMNGELVTASQVMDMISKRQVGFDQVAEAFDRMTSAGGMFYQMQEKQGNTLFGMWAKLGDAADVMYNEIGNFAPINATIKVFISTLRSLMLHWGRTAAVIGTLVPTLLSFWRISRMMNGDIARSAAIRQSNLVLLQAENAKLAANVTATQQAGLATRMHARAMLAANNAMIASQKATNILTRNLYALKASFIANPWTWVLTAIMAIVTAFTMLQSKASKLNSELGAINREMARTTKESVEKFKALAITATMEQNEGTKKQTDALKELQNAYSQIIPMENLEIENLRKMKGEYAELTQLIEEYYAKQKYERKKAAIEEVYGGDIKKDLKNIHEIGDAYMDIVGVETLIEKVNSLIEGGLKDTNKIITEAATEAYGEYVERLRLQGLTPLISLEKFIDKMKSNVYNYWFTDSALEAYIDNQIRLTSALSEVQGEYDKTTNELQSYNAELDKTIAKNKELDTVVSEKGTYEDYTRNTRAMIANLEALFQTINQSELVNMPKEVQESINKILNSNADFAEKLRLILKVEGLSGKFRAFLQNLQKEYVNLVPADFIVRGARKKFEAIAESLHGNMIKMRKYLMQNNEDLKTYRKRLEDELEQLQNKLKSASFAESILHFFGLGESKEELENRIRVIQAMLSALPTFEKGKSGNDTRLSEATSALSQLEKMYKKYKEFAKEMSEGQAYQKVNDYFKETIKLISTLTNGNINITLPKNAEEYKNEIKKILEYIEKLPKSKKAQIEAQMKINDVDYTEAQEAIEKMLKNLANEISNTKAARDFFQSIFDESKNYDLAMNLTMSIYGADGANYNNLLQNQIATLFGAGTDWEISVTPAIDVNGINYNELEKIFKANKGRIPEKYWSDIQKLIDDGRKFNTEQAKQWIKDLANARTWAQKRVDLAQYTQRKIKEIQSSNASEATKTDLIGQYNIREIKEAEKLRYEAFKNTPLYVAMFNNLEATSTSALTLMREKLADLRTEMSHLDPTQLKEIQKRLSEIDEQLAERNMNPFGQLKKIFREFDTSVSGSWAERLNIGAISLGLGDSITNAKALDDIMEKLSKTQIEKQKELDLLLAQGVSQDDKRVKALVGELNILEKQLNFLTGMSNEYTDIQKKIKGIWKGADTLKEKIVNVADSAYEMAEAFGVSEDTLALFKDIQNSVNTVYDLTQNVTTAIWAMSSTTAKGISMVEKASIILTAISTALQVATALFNLFANEKARRLENQIKKEQKLIDALSYSYDRLKDASERLFGNEYISNYNKRLEQLQAMQMSYLKQAELERQKGKKKDEDKIREYEEAARDAADNIKDMQDELSNRITGTDVANAAKEFAEAWRDAYIEFGNTADAISEKFTEMIKSMVVESLMAKVVQAQLQPFFDEIDNLARDGQLTAEEIAKVVAGVPDAVRAIDDGLQVTIAQLQAAGVDIRNLSGDIQFTGIARDIASASEESINGLAAMINTQNYYISHVPLIYEEIIAIRMLLAGGDAVLGTNNTSTVDLINLQNEYLSHIPNISSNTALIAERCERAVQACEEIAENLGRVIKPRGTESGWVVNTNI